MGSGITNAKDESTSTVSNRKHAYHDGGSVTDAIIESEPRRKMKKSNVALKECCETGKRLSHPENASDKLQNQCLKQRLMEVEHEKYLLVQQVKQLTAQVRAMTNQTGSTTPASTASDSPSPSPSTSPSSLDVDVPPDQEAIKKEPNVDRFSLPTPPTSINLSLSSRPSTSCSLSLSSSQIGLESSAFEPFSDLAQHPAAMLCGLQCHSETARAALLPSVVRPHRPKLYFIPPLYRTLALVIYWRLLHPLRLIFLSIQTGSPLPSQISPPATSMLLLLINLLISTPANLNRSTTTSTWPMRTQLTNTHTPTISSASLPAARRPTFQLRLLRRLLFCSSALARPLRDATSQAMRTKTSRVLIGTSIDLLRGGNGEDDVDGGDGSGPKMVQGGEKPDHRERVRKGGL